MTHRCTKNTLAVGAALFVDPAAPVTIMHSLRDYLTSQHCSSIHQVIGSLKWLCSHLPPFTQPVRRAALAGGIGRIGLIVA